MKRIKIESKSDYSTFLLFKEHVDVLRNLRPDLYLLPGSDNYNILGELTKKDDFKEFYEDSFKVVRSINTSIVLNTTSFFEGFLENILLRKLGSTKNIPSPISQIINDYEFQIIRASSLDDLKKHFQKLFDIKLTEILELYKSDFLFVENFYVVRHIMSHGSMIPTIRIQENIGAKYLHTESNYDKLMSIIQERYQITKKLNIDFLMLMMCSTIIDDFSNTVFMISDRIVQELKSQNLIETSDIWGDHSSCGLYGKI